MQKTKNKKCNCYLKKNIFVARGNYTIATPQDHPGGGSDHRLADSITLLVGNGNHSACHHIIAEYGSTGLDKVANPARDKLNRENEYFPVPVRA